jgi:hypothetical protein
MIYKHYVAIIGQQGAREGLGNNLLGVYLS